jgi:hypothetical protein
MAAAKATEEKAAPANRVLTDARPSRYNARTIGSRRMDVRFKDCEGE